MKRMMILLAMCAALAALAVGSLSLASPALSDSAETFGYFQVDVVDSPTTNTDGVGSLSVNTVREIRGHIYGIYLDYAPSLSDTTDVVITGSSPPVTLLSKSNYMTDTWFYPVNAQHQASDGAAVSTFDRALANSIVNVAMAETSVVSPSNALTVTIIWGP